MTDRDVVADFHLHTVASDGTDTVSERVEQAPEVGLDAIAVTDHDTIPDELDERTTLFGEVEVVTGAEVRADHFDTKVEILGYYVDPYDESLRETLETVRRFRRHRNEQVVERLRDETGFEATIEELRQEADGILGRPHLARRLVEKDIVPSVQAAFDEYLAEGEPCYVPMERLPADRVVDAIQQAGGVCSLAHPGRIASTTETVEKMVSELAAVGVDGLEVYYPYGESDSRYADVDVSRAAAICESYGLLATGGSDCHGSVSDKYRIGTTGLDAEQHAALRDAAADRRPFR
jgi:predicted metal-dependent phosphoesterase TrpH